MFHGFLVSKNETGQETRAARVFAPSRAFPARLLLLEDLPLGMPIFSTLVCDHSDTFSR